MTNNYKKIITFMFVILFILNMVGCNFTFEQTGDKVTENPLNITNTLIISSNKQSSVLYICVMNDKLALCQMDSDNKMRRSYVYNMPKGLTNLIINKEEDGKYGENKANYLSFFATANGEEKLFLLSGGDDLFGFSDSVTEIKVEDIEPSFSYFFEDGDNIYVEMQDQKNLVVENAKLLRYHSMNTENSKFWLVYEQNGKQKLSTVNAESNLENTIEVDINILKSDVIRVRDTSSTEIRYDCKYLYFASENQIKLYNLNNSLIETIQIDTKLYGITSSVNVDSFKLIYAVKKNKAYFGTNDKTFDL